MDVEEKRDRLYQIASSDPDPARRAEARRRLAKLPTKSAETGRPPVNLNPRPAPDQADLAPDQPVNRASKLNAAVDAPLRTMNQLLGRAANSATMGGFDAANNLTDYATGHPGESQRQVGQLQVEHPFLSGAASAAGALAGLPKALGGVLEQGIAKAAGMSPRLAALLGIPVAGSAVRGAAVGGTLGAVQGAAESNPSTPSDMLGGAARGAASGAKFGAGLAVAGEAAGKAADALSTDDIKLLEKYGLEPSPLPGRPVARQGESIVETYRSPPPTGVRTADPGTRQTAALESAKPIAEDFSAREQANDARIHELRAENRAVYKPELSGVRGTPEEAPPADEDQTVEIQVPESMADLVYGPPKQSDMRPTLDLVSAIRARPDLPNSTRSSLKQFEDRVHEISTPPVEVSRFNPDKVINSDGLTAGQAVSILEKSNAQGEPDPQIQQEIDRITEMASTPDTLESAEPTANPVDAQGLKALARHLGNQDKIQGVTASDAALRSLAGKVNESLPEELQAQDRAYFEARRRTERAKESVGLSRRGTIPLEEEVSLSPDDVPEDPGEGNVDFANPKTVETVANHLARRGESTKAGANATHRTQKLYDEGSPEVMEGAQAPDMISVRSLMDVPRLQLAQERLQLNPSAVFSGRGASEGIAHGLRTGARRFLYPPLRGMQQMEIGGPTMAGHDIVSVMRLRSQILDDEERRRREAEVGQ